MDDIAVINASPLIFFTRSGHWDLLAAVAQRLVIPQAVADEILARGDRDPTARQLRSHKQVEIVPAGEIPVAVGMWGLGPGESAVVALAATIPDATVVIDDLAGRKCAMAVGLHVRGTLGIVLLAKQRGSIRCARAVMEDFLKSGMYLSRTVLDSALARVGE